MRANCSTGLPSKSDPMNQVVPFRASTLLELVADPLLVEGQISGGTAQGLGGILFEDIAYDPEGQLLTGSLADYMVPTANDVPAMVLIHQHSPSPLNPLGVKGVGEGGAVAPPAAIANAVADALAPFGAEFNAT